MGVLDLEEQIGFYRKYHYDTVNVLIHLIFVPTILFSSLLICCNVPLLPSYYFKSTPIADLDPSNYTFWNLGVFGAIGYGIFYSLLDPTFGIPALIALTLISLWESKLVWTPSSWLTTSTTVVNIGSSQFTVTQLAAILFAVGWIVQFIGHGFFERRAPALLDNLVQALVLAPFFVLFEVAHFFGFRKEVMDKVDAKVLPEIREFHKLDQNGKKIK